MSNQSDKSPLGPHDYSIQIGDDEDVAEDTEDNAKMEHGFETL